VRDMEEFQKADDIWVWSNKEMFSMFIAGIVVGFSVGILV